MSEYVVFAIIILAGLIQASLQFGLGGLLMLFQNSFGQKTKKQTKKLVNRYIIGNAFFIMIMTMATAFLILRSFERLTPAMMLIVVLVLVLSAIGMWTFYYKRGKSTELWLPKSVRRYIRSRAKETNSRIEAFSLGMLSGFAEMPFSIMLYIVVANMALELHHGWQIVGILVYVLIAIAPTVVMKDYVKSGKALVSVQRWRIKNKNFIKFMGGVGFVVLATFVFMFYCLGE